MFDIGWSELIFVSVIALLVLGPKELPGILRNVGRMTAKARQLSAEFKGNLAQLEDEINVSDALEEFSQTKNQAKQKSKSPDSVEDSTDLFSTPNDEKNDPKA